MGRGAGHYAPFRAFRFDANAVSDVQADMMPPGVVEEKYRRTGPERDPVTALAVSELALPGAVLPPDSVGTVIDGFAKLLERPDEHSGTVCHTMTNPLLTVADGLRAGSCVLLLLCPNYS